MVDVESIAKTFVNHVHTSLARQAYNLDDFGAYQAAALSTRDNLIVSASCSPYTLLQMMNRVPQTNWNATQLNYTRKAPKRAYYLSLEFLMGRTFDNALLNLGLKKEYGDSVTKLGFNLEDLLEQERDAGLGNGGLGRLAACYLDSSASQELPVWGYGLRYKYGIFQQLIAPDGRYALRLLSHCFLPLIASKVSSRPPTRGSSTTTRGSSRVLMSRTMCASMDTRRGWTT